MSRLLGDRAAAGDRLATMLEHYRGQDVVVLGLPRGGVPVARRVADRLDAPLDVLGVRKLASPRRPEFAVGAVGEDGVRVIDPESVRMTRLSDSELAAVERAERAELHRRLSLYRAGRPRAELAGRAVIVVDDGIATGATARAACAVARRLGADRIVLAAPVAAPDAATALEGAADEVVVLLAPADFRAVGRWYIRFDQTTDAEVVAALDR